MITETEYNKFVRPHKRALKQVLLNLEFFLEDFGTLNIFSVTSRIKEYKSAIQKSLSQNIELHKMHDIAGVRIITSTSVENDIIKRFLTRLVDGNDVQIEKDTNITRENGYRSNHLVIQCHPHYSRSSSPVLIEFQICTIFQHAFNFISRAWVYKSSLDHQKDWLLNFKNISKNLFEIESQINLLHKTIISSSENIFSNDPLTPFSFQKIVDKIFSEKVELDDAVDSCRMAIDKGIKTNSELHSFFNSMHINKMRQKIENSHKEVREPLLKLLEGMGNASFWLTFSLNIESTIDNYEKRSE